MIGVFANHFHILIESSVTSVPICVSCSFDTVTCIVRFAEIQNGFDGRVRIQRINFIINLHPLYMLSHTKVGHSKLCFHEW